jgi:hypothetical protein
MGVGYVPLAEIEAEYCIDSDGQSGRVKRADLGLGAISTINPIYT